VLRSTKGSKATITTNKIPTMGIERVELIKTKHQGSQSDTPVQMEEARKGAHAVPDNLSQEWWVPMKEHRREPEKQIDTTTRSIKRTIAGVVTERRRIPPLESLR
jgi:hypothetical protein